MMISHWRLNEKKSPQGSRTLLSILAELNNAFVWMVSTRPLISKSFSPCTSPLVTVLSTTITIDITVTVFSSPARSRSWYLFSLSINFIQWSIRTAKPTIQQVFFSFFDWLSLDLIVWPRLGYLFVSQNSRELCVSHSPGQIPSYAYTTYSYGRN